MVSWLRKRKQYKPFNLKASNAKQKSAEVNSLRMVLNSQVNRGTAGAEQVRQKYRKIKVEGQPDRVPYCERRKGVR